MKQFGSISWLKAGGWCRNKASSTLVAIQDCYLLFECGLSLRHQSRTEIWTVCHTVIRLKQSFKWTDWCYLKSVVDGMENSFFVR